jgi:hypothetical protein
MTLSFDHECSDTEHVAPTTIPEMSLDPALDMDIDGHGPFRNMCLIYGDFHRTVFLQEIIDWFIRSASNTELAALRRAVALRSNALPKGSKRGRPRARDDSDWLVGVKTDAWRRIVEGRTWKSIAEGEGLKPSTIWP